MTNMNNKPTKEEMKQKENIQTGELVSNNQNLDTILQEADKDFEDFYWETGKYNGRDLGIDGYKDFIHSQITKAYEAGCDNGKEIYKKAHKLAMERGKQQTINQIKKWAEKEFFTIDVPFGRGLLNEKKVIDFKYLIQFLNKIK